MVWQRLSSTELEAWLRARKDYVIYYRLNPEFFTKTANKNRNHTARGVMRIDGNFSCMFPRVCHYKWKNYYLRQYYLWYRVAL